LGVARGIEEVCPVDIKIKWPNDLILNRHKIGGILIESMLGTDRTEAVLAGIGINANIQRDDLPSRTLFPSSSLFIETGNSLDLENLKHGIAKNVMNVYDQFLSRGFCSLLPEWDHRSILKGHIVHLQVDHHTVTGKVEGISEQGGILLRIRSTGIIQEFVIGEITGIEK